MIELLYPSHHSRSWCKLCNILMYLYYTNSMMKLNVGLREGKKRLAIVAQSLKGLEQRSDHCCSGGPSAARIQSVQVQALVMIRHLTRSPHSVLTRRPGTWCIYERVLESSAGILWFTLLNHPSVLATSRQNSVSLQKRDTKASVEAHLDEEYADPSKDNPLWCGNIERPRI